MRVGAKQIIWINRFIVHHVHILDTKVKVITALTMLFFTNLSKICIVLRT